MTAIRTRFAPSPTGFMHVGNLRTGLFAYLTAKHAGGTFILRLEDTDKNREVEGSADHIKECLELLGITWDEGLDTGGPHAPYKQSDRLDIYKAWAQKLIDAGRAYADPYTPEEVQAFREQAQKEKRAFLYRNHRPENPPTWDGSQPLRFKSDPKAYEWHDEVMGTLKTGPEVVDDFILIKSDGYPTYNFAHIVDDAEMEVTHVIRGQEFLSSQPNYMNLYEALNVTPPIFATMPHIMNEQGNKKLGKRDGAKDVLDYVRDGYLPETLLSFIATLGWNDGTEQEIFTKSELIEKFDLGRVQKSGARFDEKRLLWMNGQFIRDLPLNTLYERVAGMWPESAHDADESYKKSVLALAQDRLKTLRDLPVLTSYFFSEPEIDPTLITGNKQLKKLSTQEISQLLARTAEALESSEWNPQAIQDCLNGLLETTVQKPGTLFSLIRIATTWAPFSPQLNDTLHLLGKEKTLARLKTSIEKL
jgi:nondiscriminating glutamyl-tRNA synthetase